MGNFDNFSREKNSFFNFKGDEYSNDKALFSNLLSESFIMFGNCMTYNITSYDKLFNKIYGEDGNRKFERSFDFMTFNQNNRDDRIFSKFGIESNIDSFPIFIAKKHFTAASKVGGYDEYIPQIGDLITSKFGNLTYEINEVSEDGVQFLGSKQYVWELSIKVAKNERISTTAETSATGLSAISDTVKTDMFDIKNFIDTEKEKHEILFNPLSGSSPTLDPWANY